MVREKTRFLVFATTITYSPVTPLPSKRSTKKIKLLSPPTEHTIEKAFSHKLQVMFGAFGVANAGKIKAYLFGGDSKSNIFLVIRVRREAEDDAAQVLMSGSLVIEKEGGGDSACLLKLESRHVAGSVAQLKRALKGVVREEELVLI
jgi:hypothetical protein